MRRNHYETAVIINAALDDEQIEAVVAKITGIITDGGGEISETEKWGRKRLAYTINKNRIGYYVIYRFEAPVDLIAELERLMKIDESVVRFLTIRLEKEALEYFATRKFEAETLEAESEVAEEEVEEIAVAEEKAEVPAEIPAVEVPASEPVAEVAAVEPVVEAVVEVAEAAPVAEASPEVEAEISVEVPAEEVVAEKKEDTDEKSA
ncbi:MAG: 30S ribosomal protein S6 [Ignavibacteriales bacterium]|nr:30S ribosomal protein S6 [Ignavibacteriales bacterium]